MVERDWTAIFRRVKSKPIFMKDGKPSSALFKDSKGVSVDRDGGRNMDDIMITQKHFPIYQKDSSLHIQQYSLPYMYLFPIHMADSALYYLIYNTFTIFPFNFSAHISIAFLANIPCSLNL